jgi:hypothetical protein
MADFGGQKPAECKMLGRLGKERNPLSSPAARTPWLLGEKKAQRGKHRTEAIEVTEGGLGVAGQRILSVTTWHPGEKKHIGPVSRTQATASTDPLCDLYNLCAMLSRFADFSHASPINFSRSS